MSLLVALCLALGQAPVHVNIALVRDGGTKISRAESDALAPGDNSVAVRGLIEKGYLTADLDGRGKAIISPSCPPFGTFLSIAELFGGEDIPLGLPIRWGSLSPATQQILWGVVARGPATLSDPNPDALISFIPRVNIAGTVGAVQYADGIDLSMDGASSRASLFKQIQANPFEVGGPNGARMETSSLDLRLDLQTERSPMRAEFYSEAAKAISLLIIELEKKADRTQLSIKDALLKANAQLSLLPSRGFSLSSLPPELRAELKGRFVGSSSIHGISEEAAPGAWDKANLSVTSTNLTILFSVKAEGENPQMYSLPFLNLD